MTANTLFLENQKRQARKLLDKWGHATDRGLYDFAVEKIKESLEQYKDISTVHSWATKALDVKLRKFRDIAAAIATLSLTPEEFVAHLEEVKVIWSHSNGKVVEETTLWIPISSRDRDFDLKIAGTAQLIRNGYGGDCWNSLDVVENN